MRNSNGEPNFCNYSKGGNYVYFGLYPQTKDTDELIIEILNSKVLNWKSYGYYSGKGKFGTATSGDWMMYADTTYNGNKYRAVHFSMCRPATTYESPDCDVSYMKENGYYTDTIYWFKFEPIKWRVLDQKSGFIISKLILDSQPYNNTIFESETEDPEHTCIYSIDIANTTPANDWAKSSIRNWLNNEFYNLAFTTEEQKAISAPPRKSDYKGYCTLDRVTLLSEEDCRNEAYGFIWGYWKDVSETLRTYGSDYAKCQGLEMCGSHAGWMLRSPGYNSNDMGFVFYDGYLDTYDVNDSACGIRPALNLFGYVLEKEC